MVYTLYYYPRTLSTLYSNHYNSQQVICLVHLINNYHSPALSARTLDFTLELAVGRGGIFERETFRTGTPMIL
jgi:hypothetical protein